MLNLTGMRFPIDVILVCIRRYVAYPLSYRHLAEMMEERGVSVDHASIHRWAIRFLPLIEKFMLLPQCDIADAMMILVRIRRRISENGIVVGAVAHAISISGGCAQLLPEEMACFTKPNTRGATGLKRRPINPGRTRKRMFAANLCTARHAGLPTKFRRQGARQHTWRHQIARLSSR